MEPKSVPLSCMEPKSVPWSCMEQKSVPLSCMDQKCCIGMHGTKKCSIVMYGTKKCSIVTEKVFHKGNTYKSYKFIARGLVTERIFSIVVLEFTFLESKKKSIFLNTLLGLPRLL
jgi:hypothetical protein